MNGKIDVIVNRPSQESLKAMGLHITSPDGLLVPFTGNSIAGLCTVVSGPYGLGQRYEITLPAGVSLVGIHTGSRLEYESQITQLGTIVIH